MALEPSELSLDLSLASRMLGSGARFTNKDGGFRHSPRHHYIRTKRPPEARRASAYEPSQQLPPSALQDLDLSLSVNDLKRQRVSSFQSSSHRSANSEGGSFPRRPPSLDDLPDDLVSVILGHAAAASNAPADVINIMMTSRRICHLAGQEPVLRRLPPRALHVAAGSWSPSAEHFFLRCSEAGNAFASYALGMITFYCLGCPHLGLRLLARAAMGRCPEALYALAIVHFNGSSGSREQRDVTAGVVLCMRAASLRHGEATRELGHCLQDGYGVRRDPSGGRQLLMRANMMDAETAANFAGKGLCSAETHPCSAASAASHLGLSEQMASSSSQSQALQIPARAPLWLGQTQCNVAHRSPCRNTIRGFTQAPQDTVARGPRLARSNSAPASMSEGSQGGAFLALGRGDRGSSFDEIHDQSGEHSGEGMRGDEHSLMETQQPQVFRGEHQEELQPVDDDRTPGHGLDGMPHVRSAPFQETLEAAQGQGTSNATPQCFCLPTVTLPLEARVDGWVHAFLMDWNLLQQIGLIEKAETPGASLQKCSSSMCGRVELRSNEFRCCSACTQARYCSRACQAHDWKLGHKKYCAHTVSMQRTQEMA